ncbi:unnamed protein product [Adineta steineri]|uniref:Uncharacterized protein n=1 Tax=Adineta steineri TaxID=433720 RepID=A0A815D172_9BILA|nr:unnamed protein product [Adineta steineri]CAF3777498.1 unnamed protein product [Adineta steineri]
MDSSTQIQLKINALDIIKNFRVQELQAVLDYARLPRRGNKTELFQRLKTLITSNLTEQLIKKIDQINLSRINYPRTMPISSSLPNYHNIHSNVMISTPVIENLPLPQQIQYVQLPFFDKIRTIECINMPIDKKIFAPLRFTLNDYDVDLILKGAAKVFLRIAPTLIHDKQNDVLPPYIFIQCNGQQVINNNIAKTVGSQAHSIAFPTDITDKIIPKAKIHNSLNYHWLQTPTNMSFKNLPISYTLTIQLCRYIPLDSLIENILKREPHLRKNDNHDSDIEVEDTGLMATRHRVSLICPITQSLINVPTKSSYCLHLTCFDLRSFLRMNERRLQWSCPLCKKPASYDTLHVDKRLQTILLNVPKNCSTVEIDSSNKNLSDCQYILDNVSNTALHQNDDDEEEEEEIQGLLCKSIDKSGCQSTSSDCVILSSGSENEDEDNNDIEDQHSQRSNSPAPTTSHSNDLCNQNNNNNNNNSNQQINNTHQSPKSIHSLQSLTTSNVDDESYWEDIAKFTYDLVPNSNEENLNRKRSNSSNSSLLSNSDEHHQKKRTKRYSTSKSQTNDIEVITLSSSDSSDNDN